MAPALKPALWTLLCVASAASLTGCHSAYIEATVHNSGTTPVRLMELDYPSASFGTESLQPGQDFRYRFQVIGTGKLTLTWTDSTRAERKSVGPDVAEGVEGPLLVNIQGANATWTPRLHTGK